ncbi:hypothetical protein [Taklimakanibacter albus]|uniref:Uncharacterized protein n=1 Tax=Taklimakanibacter albus TaxID=2800327 RepID=A0ACC5REN7_9HYPH|nr:hypothetical protein [Aestuariivirga sp. YIM B02566]MBK1870863.1 hypothetical protein [Aestuariivirga sp. YIM B02566]
MMKLLLVLLFCTAASAAQAKCPSDSDDGKRVTVTGKISYADRQGAKYFFGLEECGILVHAKSNGKGACKLGRTLTVTGTFYACDFLGDCMKELGDADVIEASKLTCR